MENLQKIVPPLELCKLIPQSEFADSGLKYIQKAIAPTGAEFWDIIPRSWTTNNFCPEISFPAPTVEEIMSKIPAEVRATSRAWTYLRLSRTSGFWHIGYPSTNVTKPIPQGESDKNSAASAALKLWLKLQKED